MAQVVKFLASILLIAALITQSWAIYLPERGVSGTNQLDTIEPQRQQEQLSHNINHLNHNATAVRPQQRHHKSYDKNDDVDSKVVEGVSLHWGEEEAAAWQHDDAMTSSSSATENSRNRRSLSDWLIAPNTRWCGRGNTANGTYNHLGGASSADKCCRKHDHCQLYIPGMSNRFELFNYRPYTLSHCNCDRRFRTCLKMADDEDASTIGKLFFNMVQTQCFILRNEKVCQKRAEDGSCEQEYVKQKAYLKNNKKF